jgi:esterase/lipase superfamily enzyme
VICIEEKVNVINEVVVESGCLLGGFHNAMFWIGEQCNFCKLLSFCGIKDIRHIEMHAAELLVHEPHFLSLWLLLESVKDINLQGVFLKSWQNWFEQEVKYYDLRPMSLLNLVELRRNYLTCVWSPQLNPFIKVAINSLQ